MIQIRNLKFHVKNPPLEILKEINLDISAGESIALMGQNGSGKTTLVRCLNGLLQPTAGEILIDGLPVRDDENIFTIRRKVGLVFQNPENQIVSSTVEREIAFGLENIGVPREEMVAIVQQMLERFNLTRYRRKPPHLLSGGEKQRLALAAVMAMHPQYLILDEPTSLLDPVMQQAILDIIQELHQANHQLPKNKGLTTILITQFPEEALIANRLIVMHQGNVVLDDSPDQVFQQVDLLNQLGLGVPVEYEIAQKLVAQGKSREAVWQAIRKLV